MRKLQIDQIDIKMKSMTGIPDSPARGWLQGIRSALGISYRQLGSRLGITAQSAKEVEDRERDGTITLKNLRQAANALDMKVVYGLVPKVGSVSNILDKRALEVAKQIVARTDRTMGLEGQSVSRERIKKEILELAEELKREMPRYLWD